MKFEINAFKPITLSGGGKVCITDDTCVVGKIVAHKITESSKIIIYDGEEVVDVLRFSDFINGEANLDAHFDRGLSVATYPCDSITVHYI